MNQVLLKAAELIERRGLTKHTRENSKGSLCLYGAISMAHAGHVNFYGKPDGAPHSAYDDACLLMQKALGVRDLSTWNNAAKRTQAEVVAKLREVASIGEATPQEGK